MIAETMTLDRGTDCIEGDVGRPEVSVASLSCMRGSSDAQQQFSALDGCEIHPTGVDAHSVNASDGNDNRGSCQYDRWTICKLVADRSGIGNDAKA